MSGQIFISYRRDDEKYAAGRLYDHLSQHFAKNQVFMDVDNLEPGVDFIEAIEESVGSCDALIAVIGKRWLVSSDNEGKRRLENPDDFVRLEIATALKRSIRVIPVLVDGALMPRSSELPDDLKLLVRRNALDVSHNRFNADSGRLVTAIERVLEKADAERKQREENKRLEVERLDRERLIAKRQEMDRLETERQEKEREEAQFRLRRQAERQGAERRQREERVKAEQREEQRREAETRQRESEVKEGISKSPDESRPPNTYQQSASVDEEEEVVPPIFKPSPPREDASSPRAKDSTIVPSRSRTKTKRLVAVALAFALITGIGVLWFAVYGERTPALLAPTPTRSSTPEPIPTPAPTLTTTPASSSQSETASNGSQKADALATKVPPKPLRYFNDYASLIDQETAQQLNRRLEDFERQTSNQILVVIYPNLPADMAIEHFALQAFNAWKPGQKDKNNGVILFVFLHDRKIRLETGFGLEKALPDSLCQKIIADQIAPRLAARDFSGGLNAAIDSIFMATRDAYSGTSKTVAEQRAANKAPTGQGSATPTAAIATP